MRETLVYAQDIDHSPEHHSPFRTSITEIAGACLLCLSELLNQAQAKTHDPNIIRSKVDRVEINHYFDDIGKAVFSQYIFYNWNNQTMRFDVAEWRMITKNTPPFVPDARGGYTLRWHDKSSVLRQVWTPSLDETYTQYDPELLDQDLLPKEQRRRFPCPLTAGNLLEKP